jgi:hypothetical protein
MTMSEALLIIKEKNEEMEDLFPPEDGDESLDILFVIENKEAIQKITSPEKLLDLQIDWLENLSK